MASTRADHRRGQTRTYDRSSSVVFVKTKEAFGGLSNMAGGFPLLVNGVRIRTSEALYQACRFPHLPDVQRLIIAQRSPMTAKMRGKPYRHESRGDWNRVRVNVMRWCLRVKLAQNWAVFSRLLLDTGDRAIVEQSRKDDFWGAKRVDDRTLHGLNALGRLLMELRELVKNEPRESLLLVAPLGIPRFLLDGYPITPVDGSQLGGTQPVTRQPSEPGLRAATTSSASSPWQNSAARRNWPAMARKRLGSARFRRFRPLYDTFLGRVRSRPDAAQLLPRTARQSRLSGSSPRDVPFARRDLHECLTGTDTIQPYSAYKDSGVEWLGKVPAHWRVAPVKQYYAIR